MRTTTKLEKLRITADHCLALRRRALVPDLHEEVARRLHTLFVQVLECEAGGYTRAEIGEVLWPVRELLAASPLFRRLQTWPRGYQGDFEALALLAAERSAEPEATLAHLFDTFLLRSPIARQYRSRVARQAALLREVLQARGGDARVLVLGCGPALQVRCAVAGLPLAPGQVVLHDADAAALEYAREQLGVAGDAVRLQGGDLLRAVGTLAAQGPYDLVLAGGALDELPDRYAVALLHAMHDELAAPGGRLFFAAAAAGNPYRPCLEYLTDWTLVERTERELARLCHLAGLPGSTLALRRDDTGLALLGEAVAARGAVRAATPQAAPRASLAHGVAPCWPVRAPVSLTA